MTAKQRDSEIERFTSHCRSQGQSNLGLKQERDADAKMIFNDDSLVNSYLEWRQSESTLSPTPP